MTTIKTMLAAVLMIAALATPSSAKNIWDQINETAPVRTVFDQLNETAP